VKQLPLSKFPGTSFAFLPPRNGQPQILNFGVPAPIDLHLSKARRAGDPESMPNAYMFPDQTDPRYRPMRDPQASKQSRPLNGQCHRSLAGWSVSSGGDAARPC